MFNKIKRNVTVAKKVKFHVCLNILTKPEEKLFKIQARKYLHSCESDPHANFIENGRRQDAANARRLKR